MGTQGRKKVTQSYRQGRRPVRSRRPGSGRTQACGSGTSGAWSRWPARRARRRRPCCGGSPCCSWCWPHAWRRWRWPPRARVVRRYCPSRATSGCVPATPRSRHGFVGRGRHSPTAPAHIPHTPRPVRSRMFPARRATPRARSGRLPAKHLGSSTVRAWASSPPPAPSETRPTTVGRDTPPDADALCPHCTGTRHRRAGGVLEQCRRPGPSAAARTCVLTASGRV
jgi:hypothetical protein